MSLKEVIAQAKSNKSNERTTGKTPSFYIKQKQACIDEACTSPVTEVRIHMAGSQYTPAGNLKRMLKIEENKDVLSVLVQNERLPIKALEAFVDSELGSIFSPDEEAYQFIQARFGIENDGDDNTENDEE